MDSQHIFSFHHGKCKHCAATLSHNQTVCHLSRQKLLRQHHYYVLTMSINAVSTISGLALEKSNGCAVTLTHNRTIGHLSMQKFIQRHHHYALKISVNDLRPCIVDKQGALGQNCSIIEQLATFPGKLLKIRS
jgi:hypothetical protein